MSNLSIEELLKLANNHDEVLKPTKRDLTDVNKFVQDTGLMSGPNLIDVQCLYYLYLSWKRYQPKGKREPISRVKFTTDMQVHFEKKSHSSRGVRITKFKVDRTTLGLFTDDDVKQLYWKAMKFYKRHKNKYGKKTKAK